MRYLWVTRYPPYPPLRGGAYDYSRGIIESLSMTGTVRGLAFAPPEPLDLAGQPVEWITLPQVEPPKIASLLSRLPNVASRNVDRVFLRTAIAMAREVDAVLIDFLAMAWLAEPLAAALRTMVKPPAQIMVTHNHEHGVRRQMARGATSPVMRAALTLDAWKAGRLERAANRVADGVTAIIGTDCAIFAAQCGTPAITLPPSYDGPRREERRIDAATPRKMTILGNRNAHHKMMVLERTLDVMAEAELEGAATVEIAGQGANGAIADRYPGFSFVGYVPDLVSYLDGIRLGLLTDDVGGGFKIRAMSYALLRVPMLALREAMHGMEFEEGVHYVAVDTLAELAEIAKTLIDDVDRLNAIQEAAYRYAAERFDPREPGRRLVDLLARVRVPGADPLHA
jgi:hypothetical protein